MIKTIITFIIAGLGFIIAVDANAERLVCYRDYNGNVTCESR